MHRSSIYALLLCVTAGMAVARAQGAPQGEPIAAPLLSLADLEQIALSNHPTLLDAGAAVQAARGRWLQVGLYPNPEVGYIGNEIGNEGRAGMQGPFWNQEIVTAGRLQLNRNAAAAEVRQAQQRWQAEQWRVLTDVRQAFYRALVAQQTVSVARRLVHIGDEGVQAADALFRAQEVSRVDVLQARIEADTARLVLVNAENRHLAAWRQLAAVTAAPAMPPTLLVGEIDPAGHEWTWPDALAMILEQSPELAAARTRINQARWELERAVVEPIPNLALQNSVQYDASTDDLIGNVQVGVALPLFNRNQGTIREAEAQVARCRAQVSRLELDLTNRLAAAFERYSNARNQVQQYRATILPNAQTSLDLVTEGYRRGEFNYLTLLTAQRTYFQTNLAYLESLVELHTSQAVIEGFVLFGSLEPRGN